MTEVERIRPPTRLTLPPLSSSYEIDGSCVGVPRQQSFQEEIESTERKMKLEIQLLDGITTKMITATNSETVLQVRYRIQRLWGISLKDTFLCLRNGGRLLDPLSICDVIPHYSNSSDVISLEVRKRQGLEEVKAQAHPILRLEMAIEDTATIEEAALPSEIPADETAQNEMDRKEKRRRKHASEPPPTVVIPELVAAQSQQTTTMDNHKIEIPVANKRPTTCPTSENLQFQQQNQLLIDGSETRPSTSIPRVSSPVSVTGDEEKEPPTIPKQFLALPSAGHVESQEKQKDKNKAQPNCCYIL